MVTAAAAEVGAGKEIHEKVLVGFNRFRMFYVL